MLVGRVPRLARMTTRQWMTALAILGVFTAAVREATRAIPAPESVEIDPGKSYWLDDAMAYSGEVSPLRNQELLSESRYQFLLVDLGVGHLNR
jgi:hypothetical protein